MTPEGFKNATGRLPEQDDLARVNCAYKGDAHHLNCGWCAYHDQPMFECSCGSGGLHSGAPGYGLTDAL